MTSDDLDDDHDDELPTVVAIKDGDLTQEEAEREWKKQKDQQGQHLINKTKKWT